MKLETFTRFKRPCIGLGINFEGPSHYKLIWLNLLFVTFILHF